jgi:hypothetical protein
MKKQFLKTIYFDNSQLGKIENIENLYNETDEANFSEKIDTSDEYIKNIPIFDEIEELELSEPITYFV